VVVIPGATTIHASNLRKIREFFDRGGSVVGTTCLPYRSAELGKDDEVRSMIREVFGPLDRQGMVPQGKGRGYSRHTNARGGKAYFAPGPSGDVLRAILAEALETADVGWGSPPAVRGGNVSYIHKVVEGRSVYFFANSSETAVDTVVRLRGRLEPELWDPHTGIVSAAEFTAGTEHAQPTCRVRLRLGAVRSVFLVGKK